MPFPLHDCMHGMKNVLPFQILVKVHLGHIHKAKQQEGSSDQRAPSTIHFVETAPSMLREMACVDTKDSKVNVVFVHVFACVLIHFWVY